MSETWIVVADSSRARIFTPASEEPKPLDEIIHYVGRAGFAGPEKLSSPHLDEVADLVHPAGRMKPVDLEADRGGRVKGPGANEPYDSRHVDFNHQMAEEFAGELVDFLSSARQEHRFDDLVLAAPPLFLGVLRKVMPPSLTCLVAREINKEYTRLTAEDIQTRLSETE
jgi:protein required for attachment to host cells